MKLSPKEAMNSLLKGKIIYHENLGEAHPVRMKKGKIICATSKQGWSFDDFNQFNDKKEDFFTYNEFIKLLNKTDHEGYLDAKNKLNKKELKDYVYEIAENHPDYRIIHEL